MKCSARCPHCFLIQDTPDIFENGGADCDEALIKSLFAADYARSLRDMSCGGGEALLHPGLFKLLEYPQEAGVQVIRLYTNGLLLQSERHVRRILEDTRVTRLRISLDAITPETYMVAKAVGRCDFDKICYNIRRIARHFRAARPRKYTQLSFVLAPDDRSAVPAMIDFAVNNEVDSCSLLSMHSLDADDCAERDSRIDPVPTSYRKMMSRADYAVDISLDPPIHEHFMDFYCNSLASHLCVGPNGDLAPCCHQPFDQKYGNVIKSTGNPINNEPIVEMRRKFMRAHAEKRAELMPVECRACSGRLRGIFQFNARLRRWIFQVKESR